jgi:hypothetical protein
MDTLLVICTSLLLTLIKHFCDNVLPKFFLYEYGRGQATGPKPARF